MRQPIRALIAAVAAIAALSVVAAVRSSAATPPTASERTTSTTPGVGGTCAAQYQDCNDMGFGGNGDAGVISGGPPILGAPGKKCGVITQGDVPDGTVSYEPCQPPTTEPIEPRPQIVVPTPGMTDVRPIAFGTATVEPDGRTVDVRFWSGIAPCAVLDHVDVAYDPAP